MRAGSTVTVALTLAIIIAPACARAPRAEVGVVPGVTIHADHPPALDTVVYGRTITRDGRDTSAGTRTVVRRVISGPDGGRLLEVEQRFPAGGGEIVDTAVADLATLRAVAHRSHQPTRTMRFAFVAGAAEGTVTPMSGTGDSAAPVEAVHQALGGPIFDSNVLELVVAALPLRAGFSTELPFFIYERGGRVPMQVTVRERRTIPFRWVGTRTVWVVTVAVPGAPATIWVDTRTRAVLRARFDVAARALSFTDDRETPLRL